MGGNLWFMATREDAAILAAERAVEATDATPGVITTFPGGIASSASKAGSRYPFLFASTNEAYCPTLKQELGDESRVPANVNSIMEIIINGCDLDAVRQATMASMAAASTVPGMVRISAGNFGGRLGKSFIYLPPESVADKASASN